MQKAVSRRDILKLIMLGSSTAFFPTLYAGCSQEETSDYFPQSIASGDPRCASVVLWTRVEDTAQKKSNLSVLLEVATDEAFEEMVHTQEIIAYAKLDHTIKVKVTQLQPYCYYYYRFRYQSHHSNIGRTKTAPLSEDSHNIKFAFVSGQDYIGRYYNTYAHMLQFDDLDFIVHLGDYIYETTGDPSYQNFNHERKIVFRDKEGAMEFQTDNQHYFAAKSLDNYRELYQIYRSDVVLQMIHERFPMIVMWDDHEYSDDAYGDHSNYFGGRVDESNPQRSQNAKRAYWEYMPTEIGLEEENGFGPQNSIIVNPEMMPKLYRDFDFGKNLHLIMSDYRTYRPDHIIPEDAFMGKVFADRGQLIELYGGLLEYEKNEVLFEPYIDVSIPPYNKYAGTLVTILTEMYRMEGEPLVGATVRASSQIQGKLSVFIVNEMIKAYNGSSLEELEPDHQDFEKGLAYIDLGKINLFSTDGIGSRNMVRKKVFDIYAQMQGEQNVYGDEQQSWIENQLTSSSSHWEIFANSVSMTPMVVDLKSFEALPEAFRTQYYINVDQFDGFALKRSSIMEKLKVKNSVIISGDIHASFVTNHQDVVEFTGSSISSATFKDSLDKIIASNPIITEMEGLEEALTSLDMDEFLRSTNRDLIEEDSSFSSMEMVDTQSNGYMIVEVSQDEITTSIYTIDPSFVTQNRYEDVALNGLFGVEYFTVKASSDKS